MNQDLEKAAANVHEASVRATVQDPRRIDPALRQRYDVRGPRYTSYPPATHFHPIESAALFERWRERNGLEDDPGLSLYFHIPFCRSRCLFCGCHTFVGRGNVGAESYVDTLVREMELSTEIVDRARVVRQVAIGGGTPNFLEADQIDRLLLAMRRVFEVSEEAELSVEIDPRTSTPEKLQTFLRHGFNRFSLGIQDFSESVLRGVRRGQGLMQVEEVVAYLRQNGCRAINFDLIYGLPGQDLATVSETARQTVALLPSRIALYSYAHVPWIRPHQKALDKLGLPDQDLKASLFLCMLDHFVQAGYEQIGMDHFARPEDPLALALNGRTLRRNFMGYTTGRGLDILGLGVSAISSIGSSYSQNEKELEAYRRQVQAGLLPIQRGFLLERDDEIRRELLLELFCNFFVDLKALSRRFGINGAEYLASDMERLAPLARDGLLHVDAGALEVTDVGRFFIRNICMMFDRFLENDPSAQVYSRTV